MRFWTCCGLLLAKIMCCTGHIFLEYRIDDSMLGLRFALLILGITEGLLRCNTLLCNNELVTIAEVAG